MADAQAPRNDFFLPDICQPQNILFLVLVSELLVIVMVLLESSLIDFNWQTLGLASLLVQWIVLLSAGVLCNLRPWMATMSAAVAASVAFALILIITLAASVLAEWFLLESAWTMRETGAVIRNLLVAAVMTGIAFRYFFLQLRLRRQEQAELDSRIQALQSRIRPHFLFNSMNIIASLIAIDPDTAEEVVEDLSALFRASLGESSGSPVRLGEELALCEKYVHIESLRLEDRLHVDWRIAANIDALTIPLLTLQPVLENAIYHGIQPNPEGGTVTVSIATLGDMVHIEVRNPVAPSGAAPASGNRMALDNIRRRLEAIYGADAGVTTGIDGGEYVTTITWPGV